MLMLFPGYETWSQSTVTSQIYAEVIEAIAANETEQLNFGKFAPITNGGTVIISPDGTRIAQGSVALASSDFSPGRFTITGAPDASFSVQLPTAPIELIHQSTNKYLMVDGWVSDPSNGSGTNILTNGSQIISIGASINVGSIEDNPVGIYTGSFQLTFAYN
jgi:hypothetical protein